MRRGLTVRGSLVLLVVLLAGCWHTTHDGPPPWPHVLTCYGGCQAPHYDPTACGGSTACCANCIDGTWWYSTGQQVWGCWAKLELRRGNQCVVVTVADNGPATWVEENAAQVCGGEGYIIDASPLVADYFGGGCGWSECFWVDLRPVPDNTPEGICATCPCTGDCTPGQTQSQGCGNCGTKTRTCQTSGLWSGWGPCQGQGACAPGQSGSQGCGDCGHQERSCTNACAWTGWGACQDTGVCTPGAAQQEPCGDCGTRGRACSDTCAWQAWSPCQGPDPEAGELPCDTGDLGLCGEGRVRCLDGWEACVALFEASPETCDDRDNDCDGAVDEDQPEFLGDPPPSLAATLLDLSYPSYVVPGERVHAWAVFRNDGVMPWPAGSILLSAMGGPEGASAFHAPDTWPAWDIAAVLEDQILPGAIARVPFTLQIPPTPGDIPDEVFILMGPDRTPLRCPDPDFRLRLTAGIPLARLEEAPDPPSAADPPSPPANEPDSSTSNGCTTAPTPTSTGTLLCLLLALLLALFSLSRVSIFCGSAFRRDSPRPVVRGRGYASGKPLR